MYSLYMAMKVVHVWAIYMAMYSLYDCLRPPAPPRQFNTRTALQQANAARLCYTIIICPANDWTAGMSALLHRRSQHRSETAPTVGARPKCSARACMLSVFCANL